VASTGEQDDSYPSPFRLEADDKNRGAFSLTVVLTVTAAAQIVAGTTGIHATGNAAGEMVACTSGVNQQSRESCTTEVRNTITDKRTGQYDHTGGQFKANALIRCDVFSSKKAACVARVAGNDSAQVSVSDDGVIT
jgi:hypothetical protein